MYQMRYSLFVKLTIIFERPNEAYITYGNISGIVRPFRRSWDARTWGMHVPNFSIQVLCIKEAPVHESWTSMPKDFSNTFLLYVCTHNLKSYSPQVKLSVFLGSERVHTWEDSSKKKNLGLISSRKTLRKYLDDTQRVCVAKSGTSPSWALYNRAPRLLLLCHSFTVRSREPLHFSVRQKRES